MKVVLPPKKKQKGSTIVLPTKLINPNRIYNLPTTGSYTVIDNGCDQAMLGDGWRVVAVHKQYVYDNKGVKKQLVDAIATHIEPVGQRERVHILRVNQAMFYPGKQESLVPPDQMRWHGVSVDTCAMSHGGTQGIYGSNFSIPLLWDGKTMFFIHTPSKLVDRTEGKLPMCVLTSPLPYSPKHYAAQERLQTAIEKAGSVGNLVNTDEEMILEQDEILNVIPSGKMDDIKLSTVETKRKYLWDATSHIWKAHQLAEWKKRLCCNTDETVKKTFLATTQLVPSVQHENESIPKDHHVARFPMLGCRRLKEAVFADIVYHEVSSKQKQQSCNIINDSHQAGQG